MRKLDLGGTGRDCDSDGDRIWAGRSRVRRGGGVSAEEERESELGRMQRPEKWGEEALIR